MFKVLLVDDEIEILRDKSKIISEFGYECVIARDGREGIKMLTETKPISFSQTKICPIKPV